MMNCDCINVASRSQYAIRTKEGKDNGQPLNASNYLELGYMAGRFGINFDNPSEIKTMKKTEEGVIIDINSCAAPLFENKLDKDGIKFDRII